MAYLLKQVSSMAVRIGNSSLISQALYRHIQPTAMTKVSLFGRIPSTSTLLATASKDGKTTSYPDNRTICRPKLNLKVWRLDQYGKLDNIAYGVINLPNETGCFELECPTWRPMSGWREESYSYYLGGPPKLLNSDPIVRDLNQRRFLTSMSSGTVHIHCEVLMKAFRDMYISGDK